MTLTPAWAGRRRARQEEGYEALIVKMAEEIVDPKTSEERRATAQESLLNACFGFSLVQRQSALLGGNSQGRRTTWH
jgi:hypothetical protein